MKLVSESGIGTIAAGVAKAKADVILVSGHVGGTGASPQTSIKYAGTPWEMGLAEVNQLLTLNRLRHRVTLARRRRHQDRPRHRHRRPPGRGGVRHRHPLAGRGRLHHGPPVPLQHLPRRRVHPARRTCAQKFTGTPEKVIALMSFIAEEVREILASLGLRSLREAVGRTDLLRQVSRGNPDLDDLDLNPLLAQADPGPHARHCTLEGRNEVPDTLDARMVEDARPMLEDGEKMQLQYNVRNVHRAVGTRLSAHITRKYGMDALAPGHITVRLRGSTGQSLGAFAVQGLRLEVFGDANDYVGKGLSGGTIVVRPLTSSPTVWSDNVIIGNTCLYGATAGRLYAAGRAGERFAVRNSGAVTVIEGCGDNGCEYMTGGTAVILGPVGDNFAGGMSGGMAYVWDPDDRLASRINGEMVIWQPPRGALLHRPAQVAHRRAPEGHPEPPRRPHPARVRPRARPLPPGRAQGDARQARGAGAEGGGRGAAGLTRRAVASGGDVARPYPNPPPGLFLATLVVVVRRALYAPSMTTTLRKALRARDLLSTWREEGRFAPTR